MREPSSPSGSPGLAANATKAQALAYLKANYGKVKYHDAAKTPYEGMSYSQLYSYIEHRNPTASPHDIAVAVADLLLSSAIGSALQQGVNSGTGAIGAAATGVQTADYGFTLSSLLSALTSASTWVRVAKVVVGGALLLIGVAHMTGAADAVSVAARRVPLPV